jgi:hypothetical protein
MTAGAFPHRDCTSRRYTCRGLSRCFTSLGTAGPTAGGAEITFHIVSRRGLIGTAGTFHRSHGLHGSHTALAELDSRDHLHHLEHSETHPAGTPRSRFALYIGEVHS